MSQYTGTASRSTQVQFVYDSVTYTLPYVTLTQFDEKPEYSEDGQMLVHRAVTISGSSLIADSASLVTTLAPLFAKGTGQVTSVDVRVNNNSLLSATFPDAKRGPQMSLSITEIQGTKTALATFTINAWIGREASKEFPVLTHRWVQGFTIDAAGHLTRTIRGSIMVDLSATGSWAQVANGPLASDVVDLAPYADLMRYAVIPEIPDDGTVWRRDSQTYTYNESGTGLVYEITDVQGRLDVPDGAWTGTANFTYERSIAQLGHATMRFDCELEGPVDGDVRRLLWGAVVLCQSRIPMRQVWIQRMTVQEMDMLRKAKIRFELEGWGMATSQDTPSSGTFPAVPLAAYVGRNFTVTRTCDAIVPPYGSETIGYYGIPHWKDNLLQAKQATPQDLKVASMTKVVVGGEGCTPSAPAIVFVTTDIGLDTLNSELIVGPFANTVQVSAGETQTNYSVSAASSFTNVNTKTRMHRLQTLYTEGSDFVFQIGKPVVTVSERMEVKRLNQPPERTFRPIPPGFVVVEDDWKVNFGTVDQNGNRAFTGVWTRELMSYDGGGVVSNGYYTNAGLRQWWPTGGVVNSPLTQGYSGSTQVVGASVFPSGSTSQTYGLGSPQNYA